MPSRNVIKVDISDSYYHVYARGGSRKEIFLDRTDYEYFLQLFQRYLSLEEIKDKTGKPYKKLNNSIELLSYCLMPNHFHLLFYQYEAGAMPQLMRSVMTSYSRYFNMRHKLTGSLFETRYKASRISSQDYLQHITRYIHLNPKLWREHQYSSLRAYTKVEKIDWLNSSRILDLFPSPYAYEEFVADYESRHALFDKIKHELADT